MERSEKEITSRMYIIEWSRLHAFLFLKRTIWLHSKLQSSSRRKRLREKTKQHIVHSKLVFFFFKKICEWMCVLVSQDNFVFSWNEMMEKRSLRKINECNSFTLSTLRFEKFTFVIYSVWEFEHFKYSFTFSFIWLKLKPKTQQKFKHIADRVLILQLNASL